MYCGKQVCVTYMNSLAFHRPFCSDNLDKIFVFFVFLVMRYNKLNIGILLSLHSTIVHEKQA